MANSSDIDEVLRPLNILRGDIGERSLTDRLFDGLLDCFLAKSAKHLKGGERKRIEMEERERRIMINKCVLRVRRRITNERADLWSKDYEKRQNPDLVVHYITQLFYHPHNNNKNKVKKKSCHGIPTTSIVDAKDPPSTRIRFDGG